MISMMMRLVVSGKPQNRAVNLWLPLFLLWLKGDVRSTVSRVVIHF